MSEIRSLRSHRSRRSFFDCVSVLNEEVEKCYQGIESLKELTEMPPLVSYNYFFHALPQRLRISQMAVVVAEFVALFEEGQGFSWLQTTKRI
jgi:hypothetical protein